MGLSLPASVAGGGNGAVAGFLLKRQSKKRISCEWKLVKKTKDLPLTWRISVILQLQQWVSVCPLPPVRLEMRRWQPSFSSEDHLMKSRR